jgi:histidine decarboxylase
MKTHFIFCFSVLIRSGVSALIKELLDHRFPVMIVSPLYASSKIKQKLIAMNFSRKNKLIILGREQSENLGQLYLQCCPPQKDHQYLTIVFASNEAEVRCGQKLGFWVIDLKKDNLAQITKNYFLQASYHWQYIPEVEKIKPYLARKMGYPSSQYQSLHYIKRVPNLSASPFLDLGNFNHYINNPGDPFVLSQNYVSHSCLFEQEIIRMMGEFYGLPAAKARGFVTSGGTEGNFSGLWWGRDFFKTKRVALYFSTAAHYSVAKIAEQLGLEAHPIPTLKNEAMDVSAFRRAIKYHMQHSPKIPMIISANAGTIRYGAIDDLMWIKKDLDQFVLSRGGKYIIHLDAACTGAVLPLLKPYGNNVQNYFTELNISTIAVSGHKFFGMTGICGLILTTKEFLEQSTHPENKKISYAGQIHDITPSGSRSGNNVLQFHNILYSLDMHRGGAQLKQLLRQSQQNCAYFYKKISQVVGRESVVWLDNSFSIVFPSPSFDLVRKYSLMPIPGKKAGVYGLYHLNRELTDQFIKEYRRELKIN